MFQAMTCSQKTLRRAIEAYIQRHGMTRTGFGRAALDDRSFFTRFGRGSALSLDTADRLLAFMELEPIGPAFRREVEAFLAVTGIKASEFGREVTNNPSFMNWLRRGGLPRLPTVDRGAGLDGTQTRARRRHGRSGSWCQGARRLRKTASRESTT